MVPSMKTGISYQPFLMAYNGAARTAAFHSGSFFHSPRERESRESYGMRGGVTHTIPYWAFLFFRILIISLRDGGTAFLRLYVQIVILECNATLRSGNSKVEPMRSSARTAHLQERDNDR